MATLDEIAKKYSSELKEIYANQAVGDYTFEGVIAELLAELRSENLIATNDTPDLNRKLSARIEYLEDALNTALTKLGSFRTMTYVEYKPEHDDWKDAISYVLDN